LRAVGDVVVLNGPPGVGKTSTAKLVALAAPGTVCVHGDDLRSFAPKDASAHLGGGSTYRAAAALTLEYLTMGATRVVFDYCFLNRAHVDYFVGRLGAGGDKVTLFTLWALLDVVQRRERERVGREALGQAVEECWTEIAANRSELGEFVDNGNLDARETAQRMLSLIDEHVGIRPQLSSLRGSCVANASCVPPSLFSSINSRPKSSSAARAL